MGPLKTLSHVSIPRKRHPYFGAHIRLWTHILHSLFSSAGQWLRAAETYCTLALLAAAAPETALRARAPQFLKRQAESAAKAGSHEEAEACYRQLLEAPGLGENAHCATLISHKTLEDPNWIGSGDADPFLIFCCADDSERLELKCLLADAQLGKVRKPVGGGLPPATLNRIGQSKSNFD